MCRIWFHLSDSFKYSVTCTAVCITSTLQLPRQRRAERDGHETDRIRCQQIEHGERKLPLFDQRKSLEDVARIGRIGRAESDGDKSAPARVGQHALARP